MGHKPDWVAPELVAAAIERVAGLDVDLAAPPPGWRSRGAPRVRWLRSARGLSRLRDRRRQVPHPEGDGSRRTGASGALRAGEPSDAALAFGADIGDAQHVRRAGGPQGNTCGDDDAFAGLCETFLESDATGAVDHVVEVSRVLGHDAMRAPDKRTGAVRCRARGTKR